MNRTCRLATLLIATLVQACNGGEDKQQVTEARSAALRVLDPQVTAEDTATLAADNAAFALAAYQKLAATEGNLVFSPASISIALAMTYAGAAGTTASEMATALRFSLPPERLHPAFNALDLALASRGEGKLGADGGPMRLNIVNAAWAERTHAFRSEFLDTLAVNYGAGINLLDFIGAPESARLTINDWVAQKTEDKIKDLLPAQSVDSTTRLVLTNAVYFNAAWKTPFAEHETYDGTFTLVDGGTTYPKFMHGNLPSALGLAGSGFCAVALPYQDDRLSLLLVVPDQGTFRAFESSLDAAKLDGIVKALSEQRVRLTLPRFKVQTSADLVDLLAALGMTSAFDPALADLSGMDGTRLLYISRVVHKAFIDVAEKGTEAAAATAVGVNASLAPLAELFVNADHPFLYFVRDQPTGAILFMGRVVDPSKN